MEQFIDDEQWTRTARLLPRRRRNPGEAAARRRLGLPRGHPPGLSLAFVHVACTLIVLRRF
jgi:hypothetical protein